MFVCLPLFIDNIKLYTVNPYTDVVEIYDLNISTGYDQFLLSVSGFFCNQIYKFFSLPQYKTWSLLVKEVL